MSIEALLPDARVFAEQIALRIQAAVAPVLSRLETIERLPAARDGRDGLPGVPGPPGEKAVDGRDGLPGQDGKDGRDAIDGRDGRDGVDGAPGRDGFSLEHFSAESLAGGRVLVLTLSSGDLTVRCELPTAMMIYRGVFQASGDYQPGDTVTWAGSIWHCNEPTSERPGEGGKTWTLAVKKGRDGKDGERGETGATGAKGRDGHDLTQMTPDGVRY
jgi:integrin beta 3